MPTYVYETIPKDESEEPIRFELKQSIKEEALTRHPETGQPVRRVITGGVSLMSSKSASSSGGC